MFWIGLIIGLFCGMLLGLLTGGLLTANKITSGD
jgi:hypothetical protein